MMERQTTIINRFLDLDIDNKKLTMFTIYNNPLDFPGKYVVRMFLVDKNILPSQYITVNDTLEAARKTIPYNCVCSPRRDIDDPIIVETWF